MAKKASHGKRAQSRAHDVGSSLSPDSATLAPLNFKVPLEFNGNSFVLIFKGTISGDQIKFTRGREGADQTQEFTAKRAS